jgi:hypothetical protein
MCDGKIAKLAATQAGNIAVRQLMADGIGRGAIAHRVRQGRLHFRHQGVYDRLSRVRSGGCHRRRVGRYVVGRSPEPGLLVRASSMAEGTAMPGAVVAELAPGGLRCSGDRARLAGTPGERSVMTGCRACRHSVPISAISRIDGKLPIAGALHPNSATSSDRQHGWFCPIPVAPVTAPTPVGVAALVNDRAREWRGIRFHADRKRQCETTSGDRSVIRRAA